MPFALRGIDTDNGSEFVNEALLTYCTTHEIEFTRSRPYRKNDQAWVEQKNGSVVRRLAGYDDDLLVREEAPCLRVESKALQDRLNRRPATEPTRPLPSEEREAGGGGCFRPASSNHRRNFEHVERRVAEAVLEVGDRLAVSAPVRRPRS